MSSYDESLLKNTQVTKQERQEGYDVDLLKENQSTSRSGTPSAPVHTRRSVHPPGKARLQEENVPPIPMNGIGIGGKKKPFWRATKGRIIIAIVAVVIIGAIVGGAVGGTVGHNNGSKKVNPLSPGSPSTTSSTSKGAKTTSQPSPSPSGSQDGGDTDSGGSGGSGGSLGSDSSQTSSARIVQASSLGTSHKAEAGLSGAIMGRVIG